jgi:Holliday junction resolvasome RuvABC DNA-binding subunit
MVQKASFLAMLKISGIGPKTAFGIANMERDVLENAVDTFDIKALQSIPGV